MCCISCIGRVLIKMPEIQLINSIYCLSHHNLLDKSLCVKLLGCIFCQNIRYFYAHTCMHLSKVAACECLYESIFFSRYNSLITWMQYNSKSKLHAPKLKVSYGISFVYRCILFDVCTTPTQNFNSLCLAQIGWSSRKIVVSLLHKLCLVYFGNLFLTITITIAITVLLFLFQFSYSFSFRLPLLLQLYIFDVYYWREHWTVNTTWSANNIRYFWALVAISCVTKYFSICLFRNCCARSPPFWLQSYLASFLFHHQM